MDHVKNENGKKHPSIFEPFALVVNIVTGVIGAIIGMQIVTTLGVTPNTAIIGALVAMLIARIPVAVFNKYRSVHRQNLVQTSISSATFGASQQPAHSDRHTVRHGDEGTHRADADRRRPLRCSWTPCCCTSCSTPSCFRLRKPGPPAWLRPNRFSPETRAGSGRVCSGSVRCSG
ncbi:hypothetical protein LJK88_42905 [Paenibacillus sp. P26]|nr:hypothetical protein LJK88_42905 [Paenibacillus sp. P26]